MPALLAEPEPLIIERPQDVRPRGPTGRGPRDFDPNGGGGGGGDDDDNEAQRARPQNAPGAGLLAMQVMLVSIGALFITIAIVYLVRSRTPVRWGPVGVPGLLWLSTALIVAASRFAGCGPRGPALIAGQRFILFVGTTEPRKNLDTLLDAWATMRDRPDLVVVGSWGWR